MGGGDPVVGLNTPFCSTCNRPVTNFFNRGILEDIRGARASIHEIIEFDIGNKNARMVN